MSEAEDVQEALAYFAAKTKDMNERGVKLLFDFDKGPGRACDWCHYPFSASWPGHIKSIDCPIHEPGEWKFYRERERKVG